MNKPIILLLTILLASCAETNYYQVYQAKPEGGTLTNNSIVFEDKNCKVFYNLWNEGGDIGFNIYNKTESDLVINLTKTFFVINGFAFEYFQNRTYSNSSTSGSTVGFYNYSNNVNTTKVEGTGSLSHSITYIEKPIITVPPKTSINISEYHVTNLRYRNCDLLLYPSNSKIKTLKFDGNNSPFIFYNLITYKVAEDSVRFENKFHIEEITNYPSSKMFQSIDTSYCGDRLDYPVQVFKNSAPNRFFIKYGTGY
jgi:hypothetical protein